jgi:hypothetical protein
MRARVRSVVTWSSLPTLIIALVLGTRPAAADESRSLAIGVDNNSPTKENFAFLDYYPRAGVKVHNGDVVSFHFTPPATSDEIHTATLGTPGESALGIFTSPKYPGFVPDTDDPAPPGLPFQFQFANSTLFASNPPAGAPGGCGTQTQPCSYDGSSEISTGILCHAACPNSEYFFKINVATVPDGGLTVNYVCLIHGPTMQGSLQIVPDDREASTQRQLNAAARAQYAPQIDQGFDAKADALKQARKSGTVMAGTEDPSGHVQVLEMLPQRFTVKESTSSVRWVSPSLNEIHTVTFPAGAGSDSVDPLPLLCEGTPDTAATFPGGVPCGDPTKLENHLNPQPQGTTTISSPSTIGSSGVIASIPGAPFPPGYSFSFPNPGTFPYQCRIHDHMRGTITVGGEDQGGD